MRPYFFQIEARPEDDSPQSVRLNIAGAMAHIWVFDLSLEAARSKAFRILKGYGWHALKVEYELLMPPERIAGLGKEERYNYGQAELNGISCELLAWPKNPKTNDKNVYVEPLIKSP